MVHLVESTKTKTKRDGKKANYSKFIGGLFAV